MKKLWANKYEVTIRVLSLDYKLFFALTTGQRLQRNLGPLIFMHSVILLRLTAPSDHAQNIEPPEVIMYNKLRKLKRA